MAQVAAELGISASGLSLGDSRVRNLAKRPSGGISFGDLLGKSAITWNLSDSPIYAYGSGQPRTTYDLQINPNGNAIWEGGTGLIGFKFFTGAPTALWVQVNQDVFVWNYGAAVSPNTWLQLPMGSVTSISAQVRSDSSYLDFYAYLTDNPAEGAKARQRLIYAPQ